MIQIYDPFLLGVGGFRGQDDFSATYQSLAGKNVAGGYAGLDAGGKIAQDQIPSIAISEYLGNFTDTATALADAGVQASHTGDWFTVDTNGGESWIVTTDNPTVIGDITLMRTPTDAVLSVNSKVGAVTLDFPDFAGKITSAQMPLGGAWSLTSPLVASGDTISMVLEETTELLRNQLVLKNSAGNYATTGVEFHDEDGLAMIWQYQQIDTNAGFMNLWEERIASGLPILRASMADKSVEFWGDLIANTLSGLANALLTVDANGKLQSTTTTLSDGPSGGSIINLQEFVTDPLVGERVAGDMWILKSGGTFLKFWDGATLFDVELA